MTQSIEFGNTTPRQRSRRSKQVSSMNGVTTAMFGLEGELTSSDEKVVLYTVNTMKTTSGSGSKASVCDNDKITLKDVALRLRRAKRSLLLSSVSLDRPISPSESLRTIVTYLSSSELTNSSLFFNSYSNDEENIDISNVSIHADVD